MIKKTENGRWQVNIQPGGRAGKQIKRLFDTQAEAKRFEAHIRGQAVTSPWNPPAKDARRLSELIECWFNVHGKHLEAGIDTKGRMLYFAKQIKDPVGQTFTAQDFTSWRTKATAAETIGAPGANRVLAYLKAMFNTLAAAGEWKHPNPLAQVKPLKSTTAEVRYLSKAEIQNLLAETKNSTNPHTYLATLLALASGARWNEAEEITISQVKADRVRYRTGKDSNGGKWRSVPISKTLVEALQEHHETHRELTRERIFENCYSALRQAFDRAEIELPEGQLSHVLRHTFATSFLEKGGNLRTLQELLGHATIAMTMRYAHLVEANLIQAVQFNPVADLDGSEIKWKANKKDLGISP